MSRVVRTFLLWETQVKSVMSWLLRLFFSATVAFSIPIDVMMSWDVVWKGFIVGIICVVVKIIPTLHLSSPNRWIVGIALVGRGEFSYIIAEYAITEELITYTMYSVIVWGLLISTLIAPIVLQILLRRVNTHHITSQTVGKRSACRMVMEGHTHIGIPKEISDGYTILLMIKEKATPSRYTTKKNTQTHTERLEKMKYNPFLRKHTLHKEVK